MKNLQRLLCFSLSAVLITAPLSFGEECPISDHDDDWSTKKVSGTDNPSITPLHIPSESGAVDAAKAAANDVANNSPAIANTLSDRCSSFCAKTSGCQMFHSSFYVHEEKTKETNCKNQGRGWGSTIIEIGSTLTGIGGANTFEKALPITVTCDFSGFVHHHCHCVADTQVVSDPPQATVPSAGTKSGETHSSSPLYVTESAFACNNGDESESEDPSNVDPALR